MTKQEVRVKITEWEAELRFIGNRYRIRLSRRSGTDDKSARRIAILVGGSFLRHFAISEDRGWVKAVNLAGFIQSDVYRQAKQLHLSCAEIEEEERIRELGSRGRGFDPLKLHPDTGEHNPGIIKIIFDNLLKQEGVYRERTKQAGRKPIAKRIRRRQTISIPRIADRRRHVCDFRD